MPAPYKTVAVTVEAACSGIQLSSQLCYVRNWLWLEHSLPTSAARMGARTLYSVINYYEFFISPLNSGASFAVNMPLLTGYTNSWSVTNDVYKNIIRNREVIFSGFATSSSRQDCN
jgi:hypothetical protein